LTGTVQLKAALEEALRSSGGSLSKLSEAYDEFLLETQQVPTEAWSVLKSVFSDKRLLAKRGIERFLLEMNSDLTKYSAVQLQEFLTILIPSVVDMAHGIAHHATGDFIVRAYPEEIAHRALKSLSRGTAEQKHAAFVGLELLRARLGDTLPAELGEIFEVLVKESDVWQQRD
jgi:hypothetical protein